MRPDLLRTFVTVARLGGVRRAAEPLHLSQPAVSARLRELEHALGVQLFERVGRRLVLTPAGERLVAGAPAWLAAGDALGRAVQEAGQAALGTLQLATIDAASVYVLPTIYLEYRRDHPTIRLQVQVVDSRRVLEAVCGLQADVGVLALPAAHPDVLTTPFFAEELVCISRPDHPLAERGPLPLAVLASEPLVLYARGSTTRRMLDAVFLQHGVAPNVVMETASPEAMKRLAEVGVGLALVPERLVEDDLDRGRLGRLQLQETAFTRRLATAVHRQRELPVAARAFLAALHRRYPPLAPDSAPGAAPRTSPRARGQPPARRRPKAARPAVAGGPRFPRSRRPAARS